MTFSEVMARLEAMGTEQNRKIYRRHGAGEILFGVSFANLEILRKKIKKDHLLAVRLWETGNLDAQMLATMIADPSQMDETTLEDWVRNPRNYSLTTLYASNVVSKTPYVRKLAERWMNDDDEWVGRAGWHLLAHLAMKDATLPDDYFERLLPEIEATIHRRKNRTRDAMNDALIAIGSRNESLAEKATAAAGRIGKVVVDHGETGCKTPDAALYIRKIWDRKQQRALRRLSKEGEPSGTSR